MKFRNESFDIKVDWKMIIFLNIIILDTEKIHLKREEYYSLFRFILKNS